MKFVTPRPEQRPDKQPDPLDGLVPVIEHLPQVEADPFELEELVDLQQTPATGGCCVNSGGGNGFPG